MRKQFSFKFQVSVGSALFRPIKRLTTGVVYLMAIGNLLVPMIASAVPPTSGTAPAPTPVAIAGHIEGNDIAAMSQCTVGGQPLIFIGGDFTGWTDSSGTHKVNKLIAIDQRTFRLVWAASSIAPSTGYIRGVDCYTYNSGTSAQVYVGGNFTSLNGVARQHTGAISVNKAANGALQFAVASWTVPATNMVRAITHDDSKVYVATTGAVQAVSRFAANHAWTDQADCVTTMLVHGSSLFIGGFFRSVTDQQGSKINQYGLARVATANGAPSTSYRPTFKPNQKACDDPTATGSQTYSGTVPLSLTYDPYTHGVVIGGGGIDNTLGETDLTYGKWHWNRPMDGDGQTVIMFYHFVFFGHHRFGPNIGNYRYENDEIGGFFNGATGAQAPWNPPFSGNGSDFDEAHNGITSSVVIRPAGKYLLCVGGGFTAPVHGFACFQER